MFSESISSLVSQSNAGSAKERVSQIEAMLAQYAGSINKVQPAKISSTEFSDFMKVKPDADLKFKVVPPDNVSKGQIEGIVDKVSEKYNVDKKLIMAVIKHESNFNSNAVSSAGAKGLMQLMPKVAASFGVGNPHNPVQNVEAGTKLLRGLLDKYKGNLILALSAYNAGSGNVDKYGGMPPFKETQNYVKSILKDYLS